MIQNRSILYEFLRLQKKSQNPSYPTTIEDFFYFIFNLVTQRISHGFILYQMDFIRYYQSNRYKIWIFMLCFYWS